MRAAGSDLPADQWCADGSLMCSTSPTRADGADCAKAIEATFAKGDWLALGLLTDSDDIVRNHRRLLRSLDWGDDDYPGNVMEVLPAVLGASRGDRVKGRASAIRSRTGGG